MKPSNANASDVFGVAASIPLAYTSSYEADSTMKAEKLNEQNNAMESEIYIPKVGPLAYEEKSCGLRGKAASFPWYLMRHYHRFSNKGFGIHDAVTYKQQVLPVDKLCKFAVPQHTGKVIRAVECDQPSSSSESVERWRFEQ